MPKRELEKLQSLGNQSEELLVEAIVGSPEGYRTRARLSYRKHQGKGRFGVFEAGSHRLVPIPQCSLHHPLINTLLRQLEQLAELAEISAYNEENCGGLLRGAQFMVSPLTQRVQLTLVINRILDQQPLGSRLERLVKSIEQLGEVESLWLSEHLGHNNVFLGKQNFLQFGPEFLKLSLGGCLSYYPPESFTQANLELHELSLQRIILAVAEKGDAEELRIGEFYAGAGSIGLPLIAQGYQLFVNEISAGSLAGFEKGLQEIRKRSNFREPKIFQGDAQTFIETLQGLDVLIVDPPRKGLGSLLLKAIASSSISRLIYLSCGLNALMREADQLKLSGFHPVRLSAMGYFPYTEHIESLVIFDRNKSKKDSA